MDNCTSSNAAAGRGCESSDLSLPELVGEVYEAAPAADRGHILEQLLRPLGVLSLVAVADGVFAKVRFRAGWQDMRVRLEDTQRIGAREVAALVEHVQQVSVEAVNGLAQLIAASPLLASSAAAALLFALLVRRARGELGRAGGTAPAPDAAEAFAAAGTALLPEADMAAWAQGGASAARLRAAAD